MKKEFNIICALLITSLLAIGSCAYIKKIYNPDELRLLILRKAPEGGSEQIVIPYEINDEIRNMAIETTKGMFAKREKMFALLYKILSKRDINLQYDEFITNTAIETYKSGRGNCLSFTNLLVGMARAIGIDAFYVEVLKEGEYNLIEGLVVNQRHICVGYEWGAKVELVDFSVDAKKYLGYRTLNDVEAMANYLNNLGYDYLQNKKIDEAIKTFRLAVSICPTFTWGYNNLAVALSRKNDMEGALQNYEKAISLDPSYEAPYGNIASLYLNFGEKEKAAKYLDFLDRIKSKNPYQHISRAIMLKEQKEPQKALNELKTAISLDSKNLRARIEIAELYISMGEPNLAAHHLKKALKLDPDDEEAKQLIESLKTNPN